MNKLKDIQGIIFDMDNTLLQSHIDFKAMKQEIANFLVNKGVLPGNFSIDAHTTSTILAHVKENGAPDEILDAALRIAEQYELQGMEGADLEPEAMDLLEALRGQFRLVIVTNNSHAAAIQALETTGIKDRFDLIVGREQMVAMKPSPSGYLVVKRHFPSIHESEWISIGDSWLDGRASMDAQIPFISYGRTAYTMEEKGVRPVAHIDKLLSLLDYV
ncbi:phosphoglycolate phosphatase [Paenibacillus sp. yr247]|uniref:HAD family hydrolase n=1 Tax=Paenibacillus sp. yr247 TaxID=1761880 RepID=UPI00087FC0FF|nr:HAD family hydrolase [Paenibacillus sp. yr247]SDO10690.1 phosphoglycolate phosphatase [Paenibacillus sp. yr247]